VVSLPPLVLSLFVKHPLICSPWCYIGKRRLESAIRTWKVRFHDGTGDRDTMCQKLVHKLRQCRLKQVLLQTSNSGGDVQVTWHPYQVRITGQKTYYDANCFRNRSTICLSGSKQEFSIMGWLQLDPQASKNGVNKLEFYKEKFGQRAISLMRIVFKTDQQSV